MTAPARPSWSIRSRLLLLVFAVWLPAVVGIALLAWSTYLREESAALRRVQDLGEHLNAAIERELDECAVIGRTLAGSRALAKGDLAGFHQAAVAALHGSPRWVVLVDRDRQWVNTLLPAPQALDRAPGVPLVTDRARAFFNRGTPLRQAPTIAVFVPVRSVEATQYNIGVALPPALLQEVIERYAPSTGGVASLVDADLRIVARSRDPDKWVGTAATGIIRQRLATSDTGFAESTTLDGVASVSYVSPRNSYGWTVVIGLPQSALAASARRLTLQVSAASALLLLIGLVLALRASRTIARPVLALQRAALQVGRNEVPAPLATGLAEADAVGLELHQAGMRLQESAGVLEARVHAAVRAAEQAQAQSLEAQKHEAIGRLTGGLAHDFNNLLQTITVALQLVDRSAPAGPYSRAVKGAMGACSRAADLVRQMLAFGRSQPLAPKPVGLQDFLLNVQELTRKAVGERIALDLTIAPALPPVQADPAQLELALLNLLFNARDAMPHGGRIRVEARPARADECAALQPGHYVALTVTDEGLGMDAATQARVFEPYFTTKPVGAGSGLGLPQVLAFVRQSGGDVRLQSAPGAGSCFTLVLPASAAAAETAQEDHSAASDGRSLRVLMAEDDVLVAAVVVPALEAAGHRVTLCRTADEACARLVDGAEHDVVFSDVVMPGRMSGPDLARWCREQRPGLPVLLATGYSAQALDAGVRVLRKPYEIEALLAALQAATAGADAQAA